MDEKESMLKVAEKIKELQAMAKKKKNMLEYQEVLDCLRDTELGKEEIEKICDYLQCTIEQIYKDEEIYIKKSKQKTEERNRKLYISSTFPKRQ